jgi:hypothetical protein
VAEVSPCGRSEDETEQSDGDEMTRQGGAGDERGPASPSPAAADSDGNENISWTERLWPRQPSTTKGAGRKPRATSVPRGSGSSARPPSTKKAVERLDDKERRLSLAAAAAAFVLGVGVYLLQTQDKVHFTKNPDAPFTSLLLALACGVFLLGSTLIGRRAPVGFVALLAFLIFGTTSFVLGLPFLALAIWLLWRSYKIQKDAAARVRESRATAGGTSSSTPRAAGGGTSGTSKAATRTSSSKARAAAAGRPEPNKRYTPKRPPPPAPKPSRRERKAAEAPE